MVENEKEENKEEEEEGGRRAVVTPSYEANAVGSMCHQEM